MYLRDASPDTASKEAICFHCHNLGSVLLHVVYACIFIGVAD